MLILTPLSQSDADFILWVYQACQTTMLKAAWEILQESDVQDVLQETILRIMQPQQLKTLRTLDESQIHAYTYNAVRHTALNLLRKTKRSIPFGLENFSEYDEVDDLDARLIKTENIEELYAIIDRLDPAPREILRMKYIGNMMDWEIAAVLDIQTQSIRSLASRARKQVKEIALREGMLRE